MKTNERLILADIRMTIDGLVERLEVSHGTVHKIVYETFGFNEVDAHWAPKMLTEIYEEQRLMAGRSGLGKFRKERNDFLNRIVATAKLGCFI